MLDTKPLFETTSHLVGHLIREIESAIRKVLLVFADSTIQADTNSHVWEIKQILIRLDIPSDVRKELLAFVDSTNVPPRTSHAKEIKQILKDSASPLTTT